MKHATAILFKFLLTAVILEIFLNIYTNLNFVQILLVSAVVTLISYVVGDLLILPASNNLLATIVDFVLIIFTVYMFNYYWRDMDLTFMESVITAAVMGIGEWFFHKYITKSIKKEENVKVKNK